MCWRNQHVQVYWNTLHSRSNCSRSFLRSSAAFFLSDSRQYISQFLSSYCLFLVLFLVCVQLLLYMPCYLFYFSLFLYPLCSHYLFLLLPFFHYHSPPSPQHTSFVTCKIAVENNWNYADVTDTTAPHKYMAYYLPLPAAHIRPQVYLA